MKRITAVFAAVCLWAMCCFTTACSGVTVAQDIVNWTPAVVATATTVGQVVASLDPSEAAVITGAVAGFTAAATLFSTQAQTYLANPTATALGHLQAQVLGFQQNVNTSLLQALKIVNTASQQRVTLAIQGLATALTAVLALISTIKGNTLSVSAIAAPVKVSQIEPLMNRQEQIRMIAAHYNISEMAADWQIGRSQRQLQAVGL